LAGTFFSGVIIQGSEVLLAIPSEPGNSPEWRHDRVTRRKRVISMPPLF